MNLGQEWRKSAINEVQAEIDAEVESRSDPKERLAFILENVQDLELDNSVQGYMERFFFALAALNHHQTFGGLKDKQIRNLESITDAILKVSRIKPQTSELSFLYNDLYVARSEIHQSLGEAIESMVDSQIGTHLSKKSLDRLPYQILSNGICHLRLGDIVTALESFEQVLAQEDKVHSNIREKAVIELLRSLRLSGNKQQAREVIDRFSTHPDHNLSFKLALEWERTLLDFLDHEKVLNVIKLVKRHKPHSTSSYILEVNLLIRCVPSTRYLKSLPMLRSWTQYPDLHFDTSSPLYKIVRALEQAYDTEVLLKKRLQDMKQAVMLVKKLRHVDHELLAWLAITRWFFRNRCAGVARITFFEYSSLSLKLTVNKSMDALCLAEDLVKVDWLKQGPSLSGSKAS